MANSEINIYEMVVFLRYQRISLVQTWVNKYIQFIGWIENIKKKTFFFKEQYKFLHLAVLEYYLFGTTSISREFCKLQLQILNRKDEITGQTNFDNLYRVWSLFFTLIKFFNSNFVSN